MLSISSGLFLAILRVLEGYSNSLKRLFCKKKNEEESKEKNEILLDDLNIDSSNIDKDFKKGSDLPRESGKGFIDLERKILENVNNN